MAGAANWEPGTSVGWANDFEPVTGVGQAANRGPDWAGNSVAVSSKEAEVLGS